MRVFSILLMLLKKKYGKNVVVLIDEYDRPLQAEVFKSDV